MTAFGGILVTKSRCNSLCACTSCRRSRFGVRWSLAGDPGCAQRGDVRFATMPTKDLLTEVCTRRLDGLTKFSRDEMRLAGYPDSMPEIDVCAGVE